MNLRLTVAVAFLVAAACSKSEPRATSRSSSVRAGAGANESTDSAAGSVDLGSTSYRPGSLSAIGSLTGTVKLDGTPSDTALAVTKDQNVCGTKAEGPVTASNKGLADAVVWVSNATTGKQLPIEKRIEISNVHCELDPRVQAIVAGSTVNVFNDDKLLHRLVFLRAGTHDTLTVMPFFNVGQVVASERLAKEPGIVEVRCVQHPWTHAYIAVFDHPYFAVTDPDGSFKMDSLPPGTYKMM